jgi:hypothetical protein
MLSAKFSRNLHDPARGPCFKSGVSMLLDALWGHLGFPRVPLSFAARPGALTSPIRRATLSKGSPRFSVRDVAGLPVVPGWPAPRVGFAPAGSVATGQTDGHPRSKAHRCGLPSGLASDVSGPIPFDRKIRDPAEDVHIELPHPAMGSLELKHGRNARS